jgi:hypothetical protein
MNLSPLYDVTVWWRPSYARLSSRLPVGQGLGKGRALASVCSLPVARAP